MRQVRQEAWVYELLALNIFPDWLIRAGIRNMLARKIKEENCPSAETRCGRLMSMVKELKAAPIAVATAAANEQHYQVPTEFFSYVLGPRLKYSCCLFKRAEDDLRQAEENMLALTVERAAVCDGMSILELGCGWGSLTLYMAEKFPNCRITAVSNSHTQREYIVEQCVLKNFTNVEVITCDMNDYQREGLAKVDRVLSVEMFEHMKNYRLLMKRIASWLKPEGRLFVHIFSHKEFCYHYQDRGGSDWLTRNFFTGGIMPSNDLLLHFQEDLYLEERWLVNGGHYKKTADHWLVNMDANELRILPVLAATYGPAQAKRWWVFWRLFFLSCSELWGYRRGEEWMISHYLFGLANGP